MPKVNWMRDPVEAQNPNIRTGLEDMALYVYEQLGGGAVCWEIGSFAGESMELMAPWFKTVHCVDPWADKLLMDPRFPGTREDVIQAFDERAAEAGNVVKHDCYSMDAAREVLDGTIDFVYIDALHEYPAVVEDIAVWWPKVRAGGFLGGHDYNHMGVTRAVTEFLEANPRELLHFSDSSWLVRK